MKSEQEIRYRLDQFKADDRVFDKGGNKKPSATIDINAPLALIQLDIEAKVEALKWVLS